MNELHRKRSSVSGVNRNSPAFAAITINAYLNAETSEDAAIFH